jgi:hypothetical protein
MSDLFYESEADVVPANAQRERILTGTARYFYILAATGDVAVSINGGGYLLLPVSVGMEFPEGFTRIKFRDDSGAENTVVWVATSGKIDDRRLNVSGSIDAASTIVPDTGLSGLDDVVCADAVATAVAPVNATRRSVIVGALAANSGTVRIGGADVAANRGQELAPGGVVVLDTAAAVYVRNDTGDPQTVSVVEVTQ